MRRWLHEIKHTDCTCRGLLDRRNQYVYAVPTEIGTPAVGSRGLLATQQTAAVGRSAFFVEHTHFDEDCMPTAPNRSDHIYVVKAALTGRSCRAMMYGGMTICPNFAISKSLTSIYSLIVEDDATIAENNVMNRKKGAEREAHNLVLR